MNRNQESPRESSPLRAQMSEESGNKCFEFFGKIIFQKLMIISIYRLILYVNKVYQDLNATKTYFTNQDLIFFIISVFTLIVPPMIYSIYLIGEKLVKEEELDKKNIGTSAVQGILLFCWQIKRHLDLLYFCVQRICDFRELTEEEENDLNVMQRNANVLEFFQNFYSGFLQIILQAYIFMGKWNGQGAEDAKPLLAQLITSILCVFSFMYITKRADDGLFTRIISYLGWALIMSSRIFLFILLAYYIHYWLLLFCLIHVVFFSRWIFNIAIESYRVASSSEPTTNQFISLRRRFSLAILVVCFFGSVSLLYWPIMFQLKENNRVLKYLIIISFENIALLGVFFYYQTQASVNLQSDLIIVLYGVAIATFCGVFLILFYVFCKPKYTDQVVIYEIRENREANQAAPTFIQLNQNIRTANNSIQYGIYYDFCDIVFKLPSTHKIKNDLQSIRKSKVSKK